DLREVFATRLLSLVAYRTAPGVARSDTSTLAVVEGLSVDDLRACSRRVESWHESGLATPLLIAAHEFERSLDAFPYEFGAILADHVVVAGVNPFEGLRVDPADMRRACEIQARGHLLHLREGFLETRDRGDALAELMTRSLAPLTLLIRSLVRLDGGD